MVSDAHSDYAVLGASIESVMSMGDNQEKDSDCHVTTSSYGIPSEFPAFFG